MNLLNYTAKDFSLDESFQQWVLASEGERLSLPFWESWQKTHPERSDYVEEARQLILTLSKYKNMTVNENELSEIWNRIETAIAQADNEEAKLKEALHTAHNK